jgi:hypothetical protein
MAHYAGIRRVSFKIPQVLRRKGQAFGRDYLLRRRRDRRAGQEEQAGYLSGNRTNFETLEEAFGDSDDWPGQKIKIFCAQTQYQGKRCDGIRVEPLAVKAASKDELNDDLTI